VNVAADNVAADTVAGGISDDIRAGYVARYDGDGFIESMRYVRRYPEELPALATLLPEIGTSATIINGRHDRVVPVVNAEFVDERLPNSRGVLIDAGHFKDGRVHEHNLSQVPISTPRVTRVTDLDDRHPWLVYVSASSEALRAGRWRSRRSWRPMNA